MVWKWSLFNSYFPAFQWNSEAFCVFLKTCNSSSVACTFSPRAWSRMTCDLIFIDLHWYWRLILFSAAWLSPPFTQGLCHMEILHFNVFAMFSPCLCGLCLLFLISERLHSQSIDTVFYIFFWQVQGLFFALRFIVYLERVFMDTIVR